MLNQLLPPCIDNVYRGHKLALWLLALVAAVKIFQSLMVIFSGRSTARGADGIPLDTYPPASAQTVLALFAVSALSRLIVSLLCVLVLVRYRSAVPAMFALLVLEHLVRRLILYFIPLATTGKPPASVVNLVLLALMIVGLALSLWSQGGLQAQQ